VIVGLCPPALIGISSVYQTELAAGNKEAAGYQPAAPESKTISTAK
jgi:hypothetical protein